MTSYSMEKAINDWSQRNGIISFLWLELLQTIYLIFILPKLALNSIKKILNLIIIIDDANSIHIKVVEEFFKGLSHVGKLFRIRSIV